MTHGDHTSLSSRNEAATLPLRAEERQHPNQTNPHTLSMAPVRAELVAALGAVDRLAGKLSPAARLGELAFADARLGLARRLVSQMKGHAARRAGSVARGILADAQQAAKSDARNAPTQQTTTVVATSELTPAPTQDELAAIAVATPNPPRDAPRIVRRRLAARCRTCSDTGFVSAQTPSGATFDLECAACLMRESARPRPPDDESDQFHLARAGVRHGTR